MRVEVIRSHCLGGGIDAYAGDIVEIDDRDAGWKIQQGWVRPAPVEAKEPVAEPAAAPVAENAIGASEPQGDETAEGDEQHGAPAERPGRRRRS